MKKLVAMLLCGLLLTGCGTRQTMESPSQDYVYEPLKGLADDSVDFISRFNSEIHISLTDHGITVDGLALAGDKDAFGGVFLSHDIIYYEDRDSYDSGYPYGEGKDADKHTAEEALAHTVVNITRPGRYRVTGMLSAGQIRVDLGEDARENPEAVVELVLDNADITCTAAPAILFLNVYECDGNWSADTAQATVDTTAAGANLILEGKNTVSGAYVARIYKDKEGEKKLWKQDGAVYSYMSMNVYGPGSLELTAGNEGMDTELHLTIWGGEIVIRSGNDGINTNEDGVSVTTINGGDLHIIAGLGEEGDGIDSNGYLVINGGIVVASANPAADAGLDSDLGSYINGGTVIALGSAMDWAESASAQVTMNLQFARQQDGSSAVAVTREDGTVIFAYDPSEDEVLGDNTRQYTGAILSCGNFVQGEHYQVWTAGSIDGQDRGGMYDVTTVSTHRSGTRMMYTATDVAMGPGGMGGAPGRGQFPGGEMPPEGEIPSMPGSEMPPEGDIPPMPDGEIPSRPERENPRDGREPGGQRFGDWFGTGQGSDVFYMQDMVNFFSGLTAAEK